MNILFDTNVVIDALTAREPFGEQAALLFNAVEQSEIVGYISADSFRLRKSFTRSVDVVTIPMVLP